jgi:hypothetical protein
MDAAERLHFLFHHRPQEWAIARVYDRRPVSLSLVPGCLAIAVIGTAGAPGVPHLPPGFEAELSDLAAVFGDEHVRATEMIP